MDRDDRIILAVDSSPSVLFYLGMLLNRLGYRVLSSRSAEEALRIMEGNLPTLLLTELSLPRMNGMAFLMQVKENPQFKAVPVVVLTSGSDRGIEDTCLRAGCAAFLNKPVQPDVLYRAIQSASESVPRQHIRLSTSLKVTVDDGGFLGESKRIEYATAISEGGIYIRSLYPQPAQTLVSVTIGMKDREVRVKAVVLYTYSIGEGPFKEPGMGMKFTEIAGEDRTLIREYIEEQLTRDIAEAGA